MAGRGVRVEYALKSRGRAVELNEIGACENARARIAGCGADDTRAFVASHFNIDFVFAERGDRGVQERELVFGGHPGDFAKDVRERAICGMPRAGETAGVAELGPQLAASRDERIKEHMQ